MLERLFGMREDVVPQPRLGVALELRQVEVRAGSAVEQAAPVMEEVEAEIEQAGRDGLAVDLEVPLDQVPATRPDEQRRHLVVQAVALAVGALELDRAVDRVDEVRLALDHVVPRR